MFKENRTSWYKDGAITLFCGVFYGVTSTLTGHPLDTVKTKMQAQKSHMALSSAKGPGVVDTIKKIYVSEGPFGFYRGRIPPMIGGAFFRGL